MNEWRLRDTILVIFMVLVVGVMLMQMVQNDRLYDRINTMIRLMERGGATMGGASVATTKPAGGDWLVPDAEPGGTATVRYPAQPTNLNPFTYKDLYAAFILADTRNVYETLIERNPATLEFTGLLAENWTISDDKLQITFKMRPEARWTDGKPVTADDVVFSFKVMRLPGLDCFQLQSYYIDLDKVEALDERTVCFTWKKKYFKSLEASGELSIVPKHVIDPGGLLEKDPKQLTDKINKWVFLWEDRIPVTSGPFVLESWDRTANRVVLRRNDAYWGKKPALDRLVYRFITEDVAALQTLKKGSIDLMALSPEEWQNQTNDTAFLQMFEKRKYRRADVGYTYIGWNNRREPFDDKRVRQAMSYCVPRELINNKLLYGLYNLQNGTFYMDGPQANPKVGQWPFDPAKAKLLLAEAGFKDTNGDGVLDRNGKPFEFKMMIPAGSKLGEQICVILQDELAKIGVKMGLDPYEWSVFAEKKNQRDFSANILGWGGAVEEDPQQIWHSSSFENRGSNAIGFSNAEVDRLIEEAREDFNEETRNAKYHRIHEILFEEQPYTFLYTGPSLFAQSKRLRNVNTYRIGTYPREWWIPKALQ